MGAIRFLPLAMLALAACSGQPADPWQRPDGTPTNATDTSYCRQEARQQANVLYPGAPPNDALGRPRTTDERNFPAELRFYEHCMTRLGYVRAGAPATK
jgi:hypothetical protein